MLLKDRLAFAIALAKRNETSLAVCYVDLDGFKPINDRFGHAVGDLVLKEVAHRFRKMIRANDTVARMGGDEFVFLIGDLKNPDEYQRVLKKILEETSRCFVFENGIEVYVTASIGVIVYPGDEVEEKHLLNYADKAMYKAKSLGKNQYLRYHSNKI